MQGYSESYYKLAEVKDIVERNYEQDADRMMTRSRSSTGMKKVFTSLVAYTTGAYPGFCSMKRP